MIDATIQENTELKQTQIKIKTNKKPINKNKNFNKKSEKLVIAKAYWVK